ncbi:unnamed protein product [[Candida] boidinii]|nr:unnamed protein product [[Candida] boidinii]
MAPPTIPSQEIGAPIPNNTPHAVSVTLPTWEATVGYELGQDWVVQKMNSGYPRFFVHAKIQELCNLIELNYARDEEKSFIFPTYTTAKRCRAFIKRRTDLKNCPVRILQLSTPPPENENEKSIRIETNFAIVFFPSTEYALAKQYWQHSGEGISSRFAEYVLSELKESLTEGASKNGRLSSSSSNSSNSNNPRVSRLSKSDLAVT